LNSAFFISALAAGLDAAIINPLSQEMISALKAFRVLKGIDKDSKEYINFLTLKKDNILTMSANNIDLVKLISSGQKDAAVIKVKTMLEEIEPLVIIENYIVAALEKTGRDFDENKIFLPQLVQAAMCAKACFDVVKSGIKNKDGVYKGKVILATVKGDIHDIGKNIVKVLLQSYGYEVIDLGKDVDAVRIAEETILQNAKLVGLSVLMTTTIPAMKTAVEKIREVSSICKIMVGGAVLNEEYTRFVGADYYAEDAHAGVKIAEQVFLPHAR
jgi:5-methyltetrahydrofolate--homocysteine methyltransferase